jgi:hypothetical protein
VNGLTGAVTGLAELSGATFLGTVTAPTFSGALSGNASTATRATQDSTGLTLRSVVGGTGTSSATANVTVTHGLGTTPSAAVATAVRASYLASHNTNIYVGVVGLTTFTVFTNNGASGGVSQQFYWMAVR